MSVVRVLFTAVAHVFQSQTKARIMVGDPHQQIYAFRGAVNAMEMVRATRTFFLTQVFCYPSLTKAKSCTSSSNSSNTLLLYFTAYYCYCCSFLFNMCEKNMSVSFL